MSVFITTEVLDSCVINCLLITWRQKWINCWNCILTRNADMPRNSKQWGYQWEKQYKTSWTTSTIEIPEKETMPPLHSSHLEKSNNIQLRRITAT